MFTVIFLLCWGSYFFWQGVWIALSRSPLIPDLMEWKVTGLPMLPSDVDQWLFAHGHYKLHKLWTCVFCQAFWISLAQGTSCGIIVGTLISPLWIFMAPLWALGFYPWYLTAFLRLWKH